ncbi:transcription factor Sox-18-like isoform X3 [Diorhabda carinulata]|uniref:transcription factor Sox-18-like isoform X3 n=1 Tax=Diorhabda carinulata TaxID=1163345 RepID=UPI0025A10471|nr:transcription factor Sox-18-like isoform X3 [Diorhabda carinulata]
MDLNLLNYCVKKETIELSNNVIPKIPRPPNAFMLYATDNRKVLSHKYPADSNKIISKKLGSNWKNLSEEEKNKYFDRARIIAIEHKEKYPDYVYNPKEARLRKAMREANRDRSIGASPMLPRPSARRAGSSGWVTQGGANVPGGSVASTTHGPHEEPLMMSSMGQGMRGPGMDSPCFPTGMPSTSGSINGSGNEQFMPPSMRAATPAPGYPTTKMDQVSPLPPPPAPTPGVHAPYMQANPLSQLQQQTEMWHNYSDDLRPRSSGNPFMMPDMQAPYHHQPSPPLSIPSPMLIEKHRRTPVHPIHINPISMPMTPPHNSIMSMTPPHSNENVPPDESMHLKDKVLHDNFGQLESKHTIEPSQPLMENNVQQQNEFSSNIYEPNVGFNNSQNHLQHMEKAEEMKMKKSNTLSTSAIRTSSYSITPKKPSTKPLPDFNEAFGSTERGRFQSPPDPRLAPNKGFLDLFEEGPPLKFEDFQI